MVNKIVSRILLLLIPTCVLSQKDWTRAVDNNGIKIWTKTYNERGIKQFKAETTYNANIQTVVAALMDVEGSSKWYDMVSKVTVLKRFSKTEAIYRIDFNFPAFTTDRYSTVKASIRKDEATGDYLVKTKYEPYKIEADKSKVFVDNIESEWRITAIDDQHTKVYHAAFMDPNGSIPVWMINTSVTSGPVSTLTELKKVLNRYRPVDSSF